MEQLSPFHRAAAGNLITAIGVGATATGVVDTAIVRYTAAMVTDASGAFTLVEDANTGSAFTCVRGGTWMVELFGALAGAGVLDIGISLDAADAGAMTGSPLDFVAVDAAAGTMGYVGVAGDILATAISDLQVSRVLSLIPGSVIRFGATAGVVLDADNSRFFMTQILPLGT